MLVSDGVSGIDVADFTLSGAFTVEGWIRFEPGTSISNRDGFLRTANGDAHINFYQGQMRFAAYADGHPKGDVVISGTTVGTGTWHHFALTRDADGILRTYTDGVLDGQAAEAWTADLVVDRLVETKRGVTQGAFDEMRFWDTARSGAEIAATMSVTIDPQTPDLARYYRFDTPGTLVDATGASADIALPAGTSVTASTSPVTTGGNAAPVTRDDAAATDPGATVTIDVLANDVDDGALDPASLRVATGPAGGTVAVLADGRVDYTPFAGFEGVDSFTYTVADDAGAVGPAATVTVRVGTPNTPPVAAADTAATDPGTPVTIDVLANDADADGALDPASLRVATGPAHGTVTVLADGRVDYTPAAGFEGVDSFAYTVADDRGAVTAPAEVTVKVGTPPAASAGMLVSDGVSGIDVADFTLSGAFTVEGWIRFEPGTSISNRDGFLRTANGDAHINFYQGQMRFAAYADGHPKGDVVISGTTVGTGTWHHFALTRDADGILRTYTDGVLDGQAAEAWTADLVVDRLVETKRGVTQGAFDEMRFWDTARSGAEIAATMSVTIDPQTPDLARYYRFDTPGTLVDATGASADIALPAGTSVTASTSPVTTGGNAAPVTRDDAAATDPGATVTIDVLANDVDDGALDPASLRVATGPAGGTVAVLADGRVDYTPFAGFEGVDSFTYTVADDAGAVGPAATVTVRVGTPNTPPVAAADTAATDPGTPVTIDVLANDADADGALDPASLRVATGPAHGTVTVLADGRVDYTPAAGFEGVDSFAYTVADDRGAVTAPAEVTVKVGTPPAASAGMLVSDGVSGIDVADFTLSGAFTVEGWIRFEPGTSISNRDGFLRTANGDAHINFYQGQMRFAAYADGHPKGDVVISGTTVGTGTWHHFALTRDADGILRTYTDGVLDGQAAEAWTADLVVDRLVETKRGVTQGAFDEMRFWDTARSGAEIAATMSVTIDPQTPDLARYYRFDTPGTLVDATGASADIALPAGTSVTASTSPVTTGGNAAPVTRDDIVGNSAADVPITVDVLANDSDVDGALDPASVTIVTGPANGTATANPDGSITFTPNAGFEGTASLSYTVMDDDGAVSFPATVSFSIGQGALNQPDSVDDSFNLVQGSPSVPLAVLYNDTDPTGDALSVGAFTQAANGTVELVDGALTYTPDAGFWGTDTFTYQATDGLWLSSDAATVTLNVAKAFAQPQHEIDPRIAAEILPSGVAMVVEKVAKVPLSTTFKQPNMNTMAHIGDRIFVGTEGDVNNQSAIYELVTDDAGGRAFELFFDIGAAVPDATGRDLSNANPKHGGLRSLAFHPDFDDPNADGYGKFYTSIMEERPADITGHTYLSNPAAPIDADGVLVEWTYDHATDSVDAGSYREVFRVGMPVFDHAIRQISFDPNAQPGDADYGLIYVGHGDGSIQSAAQGGGQNNDALGKILRVDPLQNGEDSYSVPDINPFVNDPGMLDEVYATGFRNPAHLGFAQDADGVSRLIVTTIGRDNFDEVNIVEAGGNYGWADREGPLVHVNTGGGINIGVENLPEDDAQNGYTYPVTFLGHDGDVGDGFIGRALTGGYVISNGSEDLDDQFIFAEFATTGRVFHADFSDMVAANTRLDPNDPENDSPDDLTWVTPSEVMILFDHDNDDSTPAIIKDSLKDIFDDNPDFEISRSKGITRADVRFGQGPDGELYVMNKHDGWVYLVENTVMPQDFLA